MQTQFQINDSRHVNHLLYLREQANSVDLNTIQLSTDERMKISQTMAVLDMEIESSFKL